MSSESYTVGDSFGGAVSAVSSLGDEAWPNSDKNGCAIRHILIVSQTQTVSMWRYRDAKLS